MQTNTKVKASPFLKWAGGKAQLCEQILERIPTDIESYCEPFIGGGAIFFALKARQGDRTKFYIGDSNWELVNTYRMLRDEPKSVIDALSVFKEKHSEEYYYKIRALDRCETYAYLVPHFRAARFIYLNKAGFNGLCRYNQSGYFNIPWNRKVEVSLPSITHLEAVSEELQDVEIFHDDFRYCPVTEFTYFDPPYIPLTETSDFTDYTKDGFGDDEHVALRDLCREVTSQGHRFLASNSSSQRTIELYREFDVDVVEARRAINSKGNKRGKVQEVLISGN